MEFRIRRSVQTFISKTSPSTQNTKLHVFTYTGSIETLHLPEPTYVIASMVGGGGAGGERKVVLGNYYSGGGGGAGGSVHSYVLGTGVGAPVSTLEIYVGGGGVLNTRDGEDSYVIADGVKYYVSGGLNASFNAAGGRGVDGSVQIPSGPVVYGGEGGKASSMRVLNGAAYGDGGNGSDPYVDNSESGQNGIVYLLVVS